VVLVLGVVVSCFGASGASAHGGGASDATNYLVTVDDPGLDGLRWEVYGGDAQIGLANLTGVSVTVAGYEGEPYLRFVPDVGVFENRRSPAAFLNADRFGKVKVPAEADPAAQPDWVQVASGSTYWWHDHRTHWMSTERPAAVADDPGREQVVLRWEIPVKVEGRSPVVATGRLRWVPPVAGWPPVVLLGVGSSALVLLVAALAGRRVVWPIRAAVALTLVTLLGNVVATVDDVVASRASAGEDVAVLLIAVAASLFVAALSVMGWRFGPVRVLAVAAGGLASLLFFAAENTAELSASQITTVLPVWVRRWVIAASVAIVAPTLIASGLGARSVARASRRDIGRDPVLELGPHG
jgi:hypothetical protein